MRVFKIVAIVLITGVCAASAHAQKQLKYLPQAARKTKAIPYAVNPKLPLCAQLKMAVPVVRPTRIVPAPAVERAVTAQVAAAQAKNVPVLTSASGQVINEHFIATSSLEKLFETLYPNWREETARPFGMIGFKGTYMIYYIEKILQCRNTRYLWYPWIEELDEDGIFNINYKDMLGPWLEWPYNVPLSVVVSLKEIVTDSRMPISSNLTDSYLNRYRRAKAALARADAQATKIPAAQLLRNLLEKWNERVLQELSGQLSQLEEFAQTHGGKLPVESKGPNHILRQNVADHVQFLMLHGVKNHPLLQRYNQLLTTHERVKQREAEQRWQARAEQRRQKEEERAQQQALAKQAQIEQRRKEAEARFKQRQEENALDREIREQLRQREYRNQQQALLQEKAWQEEVAEWQAREKAQVKLDEVTDANASKVAKRAESVLFLEEGEAEDLVEKLLNFYEKLDPYGATTVDADAVFNSPTQWADKLEKFIAKYHRAPVRMIDVTSQQMLDEHRLAKAIFGLADRLPEGDPDKQRIDQLLASVGGDREGHLQRIQKQRLSALTNARAAQGLARAKTPQEWLEIIEPWVWEHKRWPSVVIEGEKSMYYGAKVAIRNHPKDPASVRLKKLKAKYGKK